MPLPRDAARRAGDFLSLGFCRDVDDAPSADLNGLADAVWAGWWVPDRSTVPSRKGRGPARSRIPFPDSAEALSGTYEPPGSCAAPLRAWVLTWPVWIIAPGVEQSLVDWSFTLCPHVAHGDDAVRR
jgi:hypothetical protein